MQNFAPQAQQTQLDPERVFPPRSSDWTWPWNEVHKHADIPTELRRTLQPCLTNICSFSNSEEGMKRKGQQFGPLTGFINGLKLEMAANLRSREEDTNSPYCHREAGMSLIKGESFCVQIRQLILLCAGNLENKTEDKPLQ